MSMTRSRVFHPAPADDMAELRDDEDLHAEQAWRDHSARTQAWRRPGWDGSVDMEEIAQTSMFAQVADAEDDEGSKGRSGRVADDNNFWLQSSDDEPLGSDRPASFSRRAPST